MKSIVVTGGTGFIGRQLVNLFQKRGYRIFLLSRGLTNLSDNMVSVLSWSDLDQKVFLDILLKAEVLIHLAGENVGSGRWTNRKKQQIIDSRVKSLQKLFEIYKSHPNQLKTLISASAVGYYGMQTTDAVFSEINEAGNDFLAEVCVQWEAAATQFEQLNIRTVILRTGVVFDKQNSALQKIAGPFKYGLGALLGSGKQVVPWIHIKDMIRIYEEALVNDSMSGIYNAAAPQKTTLKTLSEAIAKHYSKNMWLPPVPQFLLKLALGEMSVIVLEGSAIEVSKIQEEGFEFEYDSLHKTLSNLL